MMKDTLPSRFLAPVKWLGSSPPCHRSEARFAGQLFLALNLIAATLAPAAWGAGPNKLLLSDITRSDDLTFSGRWVWDGLSRKRQKQVRDEWIQIEWVRSLGRSSYGGLQGRTFTWNPTPEMQAEKDEDGSLRFGLSRAAGELRFKGEYTGKGAVGQFTFQGNAKFCEEATRLCGAKPEVDDLFQLALCDASIDQLKEYQSTGLSVSVADWLRLIYNGVSPKFASEMREALGKTTVEAIIHCRNNGVNPNFVSGFRKPGYDWDHQALIRAHNNGVQPDYAAELKRGGFELGVDEIVRLHNNGVQARFAVRARKLGFERIDDILRIRNNGLNEDYLSEMLEADAKYSADELVRLHNNGVRSSYVKTVKQAGYAFRVEEIIRLHNNGVPESYLKEIRVPDRKPLSAETIINLRNRGVSAQTIRELRE